MKRFKFKLNQLLKIKIQKENLLKIKLAIEIDRLNIENKTLELMISENEKQKEDYKLLLDEGVCINKIKYCNFYISQLMEAIEKQKLTVNIIRENVDKIRSDLIIILRERKILEKYKEKQVAIFKNEALKEEQKFIEEVINYRNNPNLAE